MKQNFREKTNDFTVKIYLFLVFIRDAMAGKAGKGWSLPRFWVSILSYKKQPVKKIGGRMLGLAWLKFSVKSLTSSKTGNFK